MINSTISHGITRDHVLLALSWWQLYGKSWRKIEIWGIKEKTIVWKAIL